MPTAFPFVLAPEDEKQLLQFLEQFELTAYPDRIPPGWKPFKVGPATADQFVEEGYYLAAEHTMKVVVHKVKRGKDKGFSEVDEVNSPVMHSHRSIFAENGELRSGRLWAELNLTGDMQKNPAFDNRFRRMLQMIREYMQSRTFKSDP